MLVPRSTIEYLSDYSTHISYLVFINRRDDNEIRSQNGHCDHCSRNESRCLRIIRQPIWNFWAFSNQQQNRCVRVRVRIGSTSNVQGPTQDFAQRYVAMYFKTYLVSLKTFPSFFMTFQFTPEEIASDMAKATASLVLCGLLSAAGMGATASPAFAVASQEAGASLAENAKITTGGASTLQSGRTIAITRGVNLDRADFEGLNLKGVAFQQSIVRDANFKGTNLYSSSFFDATLDGSDFENADLTLANVEMAQFKRANLKVRTITIFGP